MIIYNICVMRKCLHILPFTALIVFLLGFMTSCTSLFDDWLTKDQKEITDAAMQRLCNAIVSRDTNAVKAEFRYVDICDLDGFDESVEALFDYITGDAVRFKRISDGGEGAAFGVQQPNSRDFFGCRYDIITTTDEYKVTFDYYSYYSDVRNKCDPQKIGFTQFDIINKKNDRLNVDDGYYSGCPYKQVGINFDYVSCYLGDEFEYKKAFCERVEDFGPIIFNDVADIDAFRIRYSDAYTLGSRNDGMGFDDFATEYDNGFFETHSLYVAGAFAGDVGYCYVPQWGLYIGDFVTTEICIYEYKNDYDDYGEHLANGVIIIWELPVKVPSDIDARLERTILS